MKITPITPTPEMMTPAEVATAFRVDPKTVTRWAHAGKLTSIMTLGGHRRYYADEVRALLAGTPMSAPAVAAEPDAVYPFASKTRDGLTGHTITVERLPKNNLRRLGVDASAALRLAVVERQDGRFGTVRHVAEDGQTADMVEQVAVIAAGLLGAVYVAVAR